MAKEEHKIDDPEILELIAKHLQGELSEPERNRLFAWVGEKKENKLFYDQMQKTWELSGRRENNIQVDTHLAWQKVKARTLDKR